MSESDITNPPAAVADAPAAAPSAPAVQSPPAPRVASPDPGEARAELIRLAGEVAKRGTRKLLWDYLRLRGKVLAK